ncbi:hypothetical protein GLU01_01125 [Nanohaloarchaea archaeon]|nr:hypothetical protein [Candidatus Nanohaloarchaea archaeon]
MSAEGCKFGHVFEVNEHDSNNGSDLRSEIKKGKITRLEDLADELDEEPNPYLLRPIMGDHFKMLKLSADSQGMPYNLVLSAADTFDDALGYDVPKTEENVHISPQSQMHQQFMQRKQEAEQNVNQTAASLSQLRKDKHVIEHDIRKLRSRVEAIETGSEGDEARLKADFIEMVDGAMGQGQGQGDEGSMQFLQSQNIYPSITADFTEMEGLDDLKPEDDGGTGKLAQLPENEKAVLKKKWVMYEKWKDLFGSEVKRRLKDLKKELQAKERGIEETKTQLEPYIRDATAINDHSQDQLAEYMKQNFQFKGYSTQFREMEFIGHKPLEKEAGELYEADSGEHATHHKIIYLHCIHVNLSGDEQPQSPAQGPGAAKVFAFPAIVCDHVFERIFQQKIDKRADRFKDIMDDYTGDFQSEEGEQFREARQEQDLNIRDFRKKVAEHADSDVPLEFSATVRRVEDGIDQPTEIASKYDEDVLEAVNEVLDTDFGTDEGAGNAELPGWKQDLRKFLGQTDEYYLSSGAKKGFMKGFEVEIEKQWFLDTKKAFGMYDYS